MGARTHLDAGRPAQWRKSRDGAWRIRAGMRERRKEEEEEEEDEVPVVGRLKAEKAKGDAEDVTDCKVRLARNALGKAGHVRMHV